ncbi:hypothetical protein V1264_023451 [Littorina saxatilis]
MRAQWAPQHVTIEELLLDYKLPQIVQCRTPVLRSKDDGPPPPVRLDMPMILADQRTVRHLLARIVVYDQKNHAFNESKDSVVIPDDYDGNFLRLHSRTTKDKSHVQSLQDIAHDDTPAFLNLSNMTSFPAARSSRDKSHLIYTAGNVFLVDEPLPETTSANAEKAASVSAGGPGLSASLGSSRLKSATSSSSGRSANGLMRCLDERGLAVMVPTNQVGEMMTIQKSAEHQAKLSVKSSEIIATEQFPLLARFAYGKKQPRLTSFSKLFTLLDSFQETSIIACTIERSSIMLLEIPLASALQFEVALNRDELLTIPRMRNALEACRKQGAELSRDIKYKYKFSHRVQETSRRMMKMKEEDMPSATMRTRLRITESYVYI